MCWYSVLGQPGQKPIEKHKLKLCYGAGIYSASIAANPLVLSARCSFSSVDMFIFCCIVFCRCVGVGKLFCRFSFADFCFVRQKLKQDWLCSHLSQKIGFRVGLCDLQMCLTTALAIRLRLLSPLFL